MGIQISDLWNRIVIFSAVGEDLKPSHPPTHTQSRVRGVLMDPGLFDKAPFYLLILK